MHDLVIVGHGAAGLSAAVTAAERAPGARILVLEQSGRSAAGGNTRWSPANTRMTEAGEVSPTFVEEMMAACEGRGDRAYYERLAAEAPTTLAWLKRQRVEFRALNYLLSASQRRIHPEGGGAAIVEALAGRAQALGVEIRYETRAGSLRSGRDGSVAGVETDRGFVEARSVILASGGFQGDPEMLRTHFGSGGETLRPISPGTAENRGDGIRMALAIGAIPAGDWRGMHSEPVDPRSGRPAALLLIYPYGIVVDGEGSRFFDEGDGLVHETWEKLSRAVHFDTPGRAAWIVADARLREVEGHAGGIRTDQPAVVSETLSGLANLIGVPAAALERTVTAYNKACPRDLAAFDPGRPDGLTTAPSLSPRKSNWARPLDRPPYLAFPIVGAIVYTFGGLATDVEARVLGPNGPIPGLYAAGEITGHFHSTAPNAVAVLRALVFGRIAGRNAILSP